MITWIAAILLFATCVNAQVGKYLGNQPSTERCTCVPYYQCNNDTQREGTIDIIVQEHPCKSYLEICCFKKHQVPKPPKNGDKPKGCGYRNPDGVVFLQDDKEDEAQFGEFPWMVAILGEESVEGNPAKLNVYQCGGALIHPQVVLTGAHCVSRKDKSFKIRAGEWDTQHDQEPLPHQDREVQSISIHPQYYAKKFYNDVALLFLKSPVDIAENVNVVCLPPSDVVVESRKCYTTGWGKDLFGQKDKYQVILKKADLPIVPRDLCQSKLRKTRLGVNFQLHKSFICAGGRERNDTCKGDGGSPLVCPIEGSTNRFQQVGMVSWGIGCGENEIPGAYVNVALFRDWIDEEIKAKSFGISGYQY